MDPWVSFILSCLALAASGLALWFTWKFQPRADIEEYWNDRRVSRFVDERVPIVDVTFTNTGNATARDLRIAIDSAEDPNVEYWHGETLLQSGQQVTVGVPLLRVRREGNGTLTRLDLRDDGSYISDIIRPGVTVSWKKDWGRGRKTRTFKIKSDAWK